MRYAKIESDIVTNVVWLSSRNAGEFPGCVPTGDRDVHVGDVYVDGAFYRNGTEVLTPFERLEREAAEMRTALKILGVGAE